MGIDAKPLPHRGILAKREVGSEHDVAEPLDRRREQRIVARLGYIREHDVETDHRDAGFLEIVQELCVISPWQRPGSVERAEGRLVDADDGDRQVDPVRGALDDEEIEQLQLDIVP